MRHAIVVNQGPLEPIFVPSGWHHQVENLSSPLSPVVVSINHNWFNGFSLRKVVSFLLSEFNAVTRELKHLNDGSFVASSSSSSDEVENSTNEAARVMGVLNKQPQRLRIGAMRGMGAKARSMDGKNTARKSYARIVD